MTKQLTEDEKEALAWKLKGLSELQIKLYHTLKQNPGIHFRGLGRVAEMSSTGRLRHHVDRLLKRELVVEVKDGRYNRYFVVGDYNPNLQLAMARLARPVARKICLLLLVRPMNRTELRSVLRCQDATLSYHVNRMIGCGDLQKRVGRGFSEYSLVNPELTHQALALMSHEVSTDDTSSEPSAALS